MVGGRAGLGSGRLTAPQRSEQLLDVAETLFIRKGFDRTSIGDVARAAGVTRPIVYEHHGSKEGLYLAALERAKRAIAAEYAAALTGLSEPRDVLRGAAGVWFSIVERDPERWVLLYGGSAVPLTGELGERLETIQSSNLEFYVAAIGRWLGEDVSPERVGQVVHMIFGAAGSLARWWLVNRDVPREDVIDSYTEFCWNAVTPLLAESPRA